MSGKNEGVHLFSNNPTGRPPTPLAIRFWAKVEKSPEPNGCWLWTASTFKDGYGQISDVIDDEKKNLRAHIVSYEMAYGPVADGLKVCHHCDNRPCVRPDHLFTGTNRENIEDMVRKGRSTKGERNGRAKLSTTDVEAIRTAYDTGQTNKSELGRRFGVSEAQIRNVVRGVQWQTA